MTRLKVERLTQQTDTLRALGFTYDEIEALRRISMTLHRWHERECGDGRGCIDRDEKTGIPYWLDSFSNRHTKIPDRETGALKKLALIMSKYPKLASYIQGDPRGAALYILRPGDIPKGADPDSCYNNGIAVYK